MNLQDLIRSKTYGPFKRACVTEAISDSVAGPGLAVIYFSYDPE